jgi:hypothetical protein
MRALLAIPATSLALAGAPAAGHGGVYPITAAEAAAAITAQIHKQVASEQRLSAAPRTLLLG